MTFSGFGDLLKAWRKLRRLTQKELATLMGVHRNTIGTWELGNFLPESKTVVLELAHQLRLDSNETRRLLEASLTALSPYWYVPYQRNPFFTGREEVLQRLREALTHEHSAILSQSYALSGLGGIGKTQTAIEYAYRYADDYSAVFWVSAETTEAILSSMAAIADILNVPEKQEKEQEKIIGAIMRWFNNHKDWLLIFDNIEDLAHVKRFLPPSRAGSLLFTSRRQSLGLSAQTLTLERVSSDEGIYFLLRRARFIDAISSLAQISSADTACAQDIVTAMDGLPLALDQAGAYIEATKCSFSTYLELFQASQVRLLDERDEYDNHPLSVTKTFGLIFEQLKMSSPTAAELLTVCAYLAPDEIPEMFFRQGASSLGPLFEKLIADPLTFHAALKALLMYSVVQRNSINQTLSIHRLVQAVIKAHISEEIHQPWIARVLHTMAQIFPAYEDRQPDYWKTSGQLLPHALLCITQSLPPTEDKTLQTMRITLMCHVADYLFRRAQYAEAELLFQQALQLSEQTLEPGHFLHTEVLNGLAELYRTQGKYDEAQSLFLQVLQTREQTLGSKHRSLVSPLNRLANLYTNLGQSKEIEPLYLRALSILKHHPGPEQSLVVETLNNLAVLYLIQGKFAQAEQLLQQGYTIWEQKLLSDNLTITHSLCNLALCYYEQGKYEQVAPLYQQALDIMEQRLGKNHTRVSTPLHGLALLYYQLRDYEKAEPFTQRALSIREQTLGPEHHAVAMTLNLLAAIMKAKGMYKQAELLFQRSLYIGEKTSGPEHVNVARPLNNLANLYIQQGKYRSAEPLYLRALHIREQAHGPNHPYLAHPLNGLANCYFKQEQYEQAEALYQRALHIRETQLGQHPDTAETLSDFAAFQEAMGKNQEALSLYQRTLTIREQILGAEHLETQEARANYERLQERVKQTPALSNQADKPVEQSREAYPTCPTCQHNDSVVQSGVNRTGTQRFRCRSCQRYFTPGAKPRGYDAAVKAQAQTLTRAGVSTREIAQQLNVHHSTVSLWAKEHQN